MKTIFTVLVLMMSAFFLNAQVFTEYFEGTTVGADVEGVNGWYVSKKSGDALGVSPVIGAGSLSYPGYVGSGIGNVAVLDPAIGEDATTQRISTKLVTLNGEPLQNVDGEKFYVAFLVKVSEDSKTNAWRDFFMFEGSETSSMTRGRVFARVATNKDLYLTVTKNATPSNPVEGDPVFDINQPHLLVMAYEGFEGESNDVVTLYVNPDPDQDEASQLYKVESSDSQTDYSSTAKLGINLRQRAIGAEIGGIRVAKSWEELFEEVSVGIKNNRALDISGFVYGGNNSATVNQAGEVEVYNLAGSKVYSGVSDGQLNVDLAKGVYVVKLATQSGSVYSEKVIVK